LLRSAPYFPVADVERSATHYERVLGFRLVDRPQDISPNEKQGGTWDAFFWVRGVRALHAELRASGADIVYGPIVQEAYQMEEFAVRDHDGYVLGFGEPR
jgi:catechol 2,3-dioxygenase-like lactoylglutathione lyase family enzyme